MILIRHGQSHFNVHFGATREDPGIVDPGLTELGVSQTEEAGRSLSGQDIRRILASPYSRTLETAEIIAGRLDLEVEIEPLVREHAYFTCDVGSPRSQLSTRWPHFDFGDLEETWWPDRESEAEVLERCRRFRSVMAEVEDWRYVLVVTHWGFIRGLTGREVGNAEILSFDLAVPL
jgi:broad specificity phosphatase PhoE